MSKAKETRALMSGKRVTTMIKPLESIPKKLSNFMIFLKKDIFYIFVSHEVTKVDKTVWHRKKSNFHHQHLWVFGTWIVITIALSFLSCKLVFFSSKQKFSLSSCSNFMTFTHLQISHICRKKGILCILHHGSSHKVVPFKNLQIKKSFPSLKLFIPSKDYFSQEK